MPKAAREMPTSGAEAAGGIATRESLCWAEVASLSPALYPEIIHGFSTRKGAGKRAKGRVDFREPPEGDGKIYRQSLSDLAKELGIAQARIVYPEQEHGNRVLVLNKDDPPADLAALRKERADAIVTNIANLAIAVRTADCVPILLYDPRGGAIGAVHAGWRGTVAGVLARTVQVMVKEFNCEPINLAAAIGPAISMQSFEVDEPVLGQFRDRFPFWSRFTRPARHGKWLVDLKMINAYILASLGVQERNLECSPLCTVQDKEWLYSHRREGEEAGRMLNFIMLHAAQKRKTFRLTRGKGNP